MNLSNPLGSPWDVFATLTKANIDAAGMGHDDVSESSSNSDTLEEVSQAQFSDALSDEVLIAEEVHRDEDEEVPVAPASPVWNNGGLPIIESESDEDGPPPPPRHTGPTMWIELDSDEDEDRYVVETRRRRVTNILKRGY